MDFIWASEISAIFSQFQNTEETNNQLYIKHYHNLWIHMITHAMPGTSTFLPRYPVSLIQRCQVSIYTCTSGTFLNEICHAVRAATNATGNNGTKVCKHQTD